MYLRVEADRRGRCNSHAPGVSELGGDPGNECHKSSEGRSGSPEDMIPFSIDPGKVAQDGEGVSIKQKRSQHTEERAQRVPARPYISEIESDPDNDRNHAREP